MVTAADGDIAPESDGWRHYRKRRLDRGILAGRVPMPTKIADGIRLHQAADAAWRAGEAILHQPGALDDAAALDEAIRLMNESRALRERAGPPFTLHIGKVRISVGLGLPCSRRRPPEIPEPPEPLTEMTPAELATWRRQFFRTIRDDEIRRGVRRPRTMREVEIMRQGNAEREERLAQRIARAKRRQQRRTGS